MVDFRPVQYPWKNVVWKFLVHCPFSSVKGILSVMWQKHFFLNKLIPMPLSVFNVLHPPLGALAVTYPQSPGLLTLTATTSYPQIVHNAAAYNHPVTTHVSPLSKKSTGRNPEGAEPSVVTPLWPGWPTTNCTLLWCLMTGCKLAQTQSKSH